MPVRPCRVSPERNETRTSISSPRASFKRLARISAFSRRFEVAATRRDVSTTLASRKPTAPVLHAQAQQPAPPAGRYVAGSSVAAIAATFARSTFRGNADEKLPNAPVTPVLGGYFFAASTMTFEKTAVSSRVATWEDTPRPT